MLINEERPYSPLFLEIHYSKSSSLFFESLASKITCHLSSRRKGRKKRLERKIPSSVRKGEAEERTRRRRLAKRLELELEFYVTTGR